MTRIFDFYFSLILFAESIYPLLFLYLLTVLLIISIIIYLSNFICYFIFILQSQSFILTQN